MIRGGQRGDKVKRRVIESLVVVPGVLSGVVDQGEALAFAVGVKRPERTTSSFTIVANWVTSGGFPGRRGRREGRRHLSRHQSESTDAQVASLLLGVASCAIGARTLAESIQVAKFVMSSTRPERSTRKSRPFRHDTPLDLFELGLD